MRKTLLCYTLILYSLIAHSQCWTEVSPGGIHSIGLRDGGTLWSWGRNNSGQLGTGENNSTINKSPKQVGTDGNWSRISAGNSHNLAIKTDGTLWAWGRNSDGQIGIGSNASSFNTPQQIGTDTDWAYISAGDEFSLALKTNGTLWAWGDNFFGQLGDNSTDDRNAPVQIGTATNWVSISAGTQHSLAVKTNGELWAWGTNNTSRFGTNTPATSYAPMQIGTDTDWSKVLAGRDHGVGIKTNGTFWTWGGNTTGQLGDGSTVDKTTPINIASLNGAVKIAKGHQHTAVIKNDGSIWSWGGNATGQLGIGSSLTPTPPSPTLVPTQENTFSNNWAYIDSKITHTVAIKADGSLFTWGSNLWGQLGDGSQIAKSSPVAITCPTLTTTDFENQESIAIYPNPAHSFISIRNEKNLSFTSIKVIDLFGKVLIEPLVSEEINVEGLSSGMYFIQAAANGQLYQAKFIRN
ncbi:T9SS type A sorting domain-containing protein [Flavobacterium amniphilum]|uniref:RCC1 domain-containing protein n=1 Tax=Flavobacterium amniphilum TaxID=1834035 RepID=UPI00202A6425|nr:T9SS type A sorting domain-containing protein [Flavobacterium amniphilum]MCL9804079.1 T9SS type A sorting domain-containing protein [Flavobacterium amniphilum]